MTDRTDPDQLSDTAAAFRQRIEREIAGVGPRVDAHQAWADSHSAPRRRLRRPALAGIGVAADIAVVVGVIVAVPGGGRGGGGPTEVPGTQPKSGEVMPAPVDAGSTTVQSRPATVPNTSGIPGVVEYDTTVSTDTGQADDCLPAGVICHLHVTGPVTYAVTPPVGGPHNPTWMNCGVYDEPVPSERAVHDLEHGAVWITYRPDLPAAQVQQLRELFRSQSDASVKGQDLGAKYLDLTPWASDALPSPIVISSWGAQLAVDSPADPRLQQFIDTFRLDVAQTYEAGASCSGQPDGGTPLFS